MGAFQCWSIADRKMHAVFLQIFLLLGAHTKTTCCYGWPMFSLSPCTERQHLGSIPDHLSRIHAQQLAPGVHPLCAQIQGEDPWRYWVSTSAETPVKNTYAGILASSFLLFTGVFFTPLINPVLSGFCEKCWETIESKHTQDKVLRDAKHF